MWHPCMSIYLSCYAYAVSSMEFQSFEVKSEADSNDVTECSHDVKPSVGRFAFSHGLFSALSISCDSG